MAVTKGVRTVLARPRTEIGISAAATGLVWYVNPSQLEDETSFAHGYSFKKVECRNGRWTEIQDCHASTCHGTNDGAARC